MGAVSWINVPLCGPGRHLKRAADIFHPLAHVAQPISAGLAGRLTRTAPVVFDLQREGCRGQPQADFHLGRLGVFDDIVDGFLEGEKDVVPQVGRDDLRRELGGHVQPIAQTGQFQVILRVLAGVIDQALQRVV